MLQQITDRSYGIIRNINSNSNFKINDYNDNIKLSKKKTKLQKINNFMKRVDNLKKHKDS